MIGVLVGKNQNAPIEGIETISRVSDSIFTPSSKNQNAPIEGIETEWAAIRAPSSTGKNQNAPIEGIETRVFHVEDDVVRE